MLIICLWILLANVKMRLFIVEHIEVLELEMVWGRSDTDEHMLLPHTHTNEKKNNFPESTDDQSSLFLWNSSSIRRRNKHTIKYTEL